MVGWKLMKTFAENKRAGFDYELLETFEAGMVLTGHEAKSARLGHPGISGAHCIVRSGEIFVVGMRLPSFQPGNEPHAYESERTRKLLLSKKEITRISEKMKNGLTLVPLRIYNDKRGYLKLSVALARGKKQYDKREVIKKRETEREIRRFQKRIRG